METLVPGPPVWPGPPLAVQPGDLTQFAPHGMNLAGPVVVRPWDTLGQALRARDDYYGARPHGPHPIRDAPVTDPAGGTVYFDNDVEGERFATLLAILDVAGEPSTFAAFRAEAARPDDERFLAQLRIVSPNALDALYGAEPVAELIGQPLTVREALEDFMRAERERWGTQMGGKLTGLFGGDGDWAKEKLCFGLMVENAYHGVYRIWSRAWLVTK